MGSRLYREGVPCTPPCVTGVLPVGNEPLRAFNRSKRQPDFWVSKDTGAARVLEKGSLAGKGGLFGGRPPSCHYGHCKGYTVLEIRTQISS